MNAYGATRAVEALALKEIIPLLSAASLEGRFVCTSKGRSAQRLQKEIGDFALNTDEQHIVTIELKSESSNKYGNLFLETWSNRSRYTRGWMDALDTDVILYYFQDTHELFSVSFPALREWAFHRGRVYDFPEKKQAKYNQLNDTWGRCVPIRILSKELGDNMKKITLPASQDEILSLFWFERDSTCRKVRRTGLSN